MIEIELEPNERALAVMSSWEERLGDPMIVSDIINRIFSSQSRLTSGMSSATVITGDRIPTHLLNPHRSGMYMD